MISVKSKKKTIQTKANLSLKDAPKNMKAKKMLELLPL